MVLNDIQAGMADSDLILLEGLKNHDRNCIEKIYKDYFPVIRSLIINNNGSEDDVSDIFQEAMIILFDCVQRPDFTLNSRLKTFLYSICRRLWLKKLQQVHRKKIQVELLEETIPVEDITEEHEALQTNLKKMEKVLNALGEPCKSLLESFYIHKKPMLQIAADFGYTNADNAKTQKYKCLLRLKKLFFSDTKNR